MMVAATHLRVGVAAIVGMLTTQAGAALAAECDAPTPSFQVSKPPPSVSPGAAAFNGVWSGTWTINVRNGTLFLCTKLYVSVKDNANASVAYCRGTLKEVGRLPECGTWDAHIADGVLTIGNQTFKPSGPNKLSAQGVQQGNGNPIFAEFQRER